MPQPYSCADISKGQEPISVKAVNLYTFDELPLLEFQYTATTSIDPEIDQLFLPNQASPRKDYTHFSLRLFHIIVALFRDVHAFLAKRTLALVSLVARSAMTLIND